MTKAYYTQEVEQIYQELQTNPKTGLTEQEVNKRLEEYGYNEIPKPSRGFIKIYLAPLFNWLIVIYLFGGLILLISSFFGGEENLMLIAVTLGVVVLNCFIAIFQQYRATKKLNALRELSAPTTTVIRNNKKSDVITRNLVAGDILVINQGDKIPADARIIESSNLEVNEASLTGESEPVKKLSDGKALKDTNDEYPIGERINMVFYGTYTTTGNGKAVIVETGPHTEIGKLSHKLEEAGTSDIPIRQKMNHFGKWLGIGVMGLWLLLTIIMVAVNVDNINNFVGYLNSAMDLMPINLPLMTTIVLITGVVAMAHQGVIIRNLASVDSLGRVSVVCTDKTGTLTKNQMSVQYVWTNGSIFKVTGSGYSPEGEIIKTDDPKNPEYIKHIDDFPQLKLLLISGFLNNNSALVKNEIEVGKKFIDNWSVVGSPTEGALMVLFQKGMGDYLLESYESIKEYPFDSAIKTMTKIYLKEEEYFSFTKGASEMLIPNCSKILYKNANIEFSSELKKEVMNKIDEYANRGYRILSLCYKEFFALPSHEDKDRGKFESDMTYLGFVTILDPPREGVKDSVKQCHNAGVEVVMITGDSPTTARAIAEQIGIVDDENEIACEGKDIKEAIKSKDFDKIRVFARVSPEHKQDIVNKYKDDKRVVAMTGDGVNDALALNLADAGVAMGITGTDVAKEAADMVISDDSFNSIVTGIHQGRGIFAKIRAIIVFFICINVFEGLVQVVLYIILGLPYWFDARFSYMWVFLSLSIHALPSLGLTFDQISDDVMEEKPKDTEEILSKNTLILMTSFGICLAVSMITIYAIAYSIPTPPLDFGALNEGYLYTPATLNIGGFVYDPREGKTLTMLMVVLFTSEAFLVFQIRRPNKSLIKSLKEDGNKYVYLSIGLVFIALFALMYIPGLQTFFAEKGYNFCLMYLNALDWVVCIAVAMICTVSFEAVKFYARKKGIIF